MNELALKFALSLTLTLLLELPVSLLFRARGKDLLLVFLVNVLTNPAAVLVCVLTGDRLLAEGWYYRTYGNGIRHPYRCAAACNLFSYITGAVLGILL